MIKKVGILNAGGDVQSLNAVIAAIVKAGTPLGYEFVGFEKGWEGVLSPMVYRTLDMKAVRGISHIGGTILHTVNKGRFNAKAAMGGRQLVDEAIINEAVSNLEKAGVEVLIAIGGDGTLSGAIQFIEKGVKIIGVPKTIDNDLNSTDRTFGFSTAVDVVVEAIDRVHTTATSHDRVFFVETMGRHVGWIALYSGLAGGADMILLPEIDFDYNVVINFLRDRKANGFRSSIVVVAEGANAKNENQTYTDNKANGEVHFGGVSSILMNKIDQMAPGEFELRNVVLGHVQRGGTPNADDRVIAKAYGVGAIDAIQNEKWGHMVSLKDGKIITVPLSDAISDLKSVTEDNIAFHAAQKMGISFGV
jgi:ATP-dependent phosphofructokinase / diphosphate-dependent phosphofructokinase